MEHPFKGSFILTFHKGLQRQKEQPLLIILLLKLFMFYLFVLHLIRATSINCCRISTNEVLYRFFCVLLYTMTVPPNELNKMFHVLSLNKPGKPHQPPQTHGNSIHRLTSTDYSGWRGCKNNPANPKALNSFGILRHTGNSTVVQYVQQVLKTVSGNRGSLPPAGSSSVFVQLEQTP